MQSAKLPENEEERIKTLSDYSLLDTMPEQIFDDLTKISTEICNTSISLVTLVDRDRQWFKSKIGMDAVETSRDVAFCSHAILQEEVFVVEDTLKDERFFDNPLVTEEPNIRFYAGAPIKAANGLALGTLCVIDQKPMQLEDHKVEALVALARQVEVCIELRRQYELSNKAKKELEAKNGELASALEEVETLRGIIPICSYCNQIRNDNGIWERIESYLTKYTDAKFSHGICPDCVTQVKASDDYRNIKQ